METDTESPSPAEREPTRTDQAIAIGSRLRAVRHQTGLSLVAVESASQQEFRASVLGAYERGERVITVDRLQRLAKLYNVPVDQLLPDDTRRSPWPDGDDGADSGAAYPPGVERPQRVSIDLAKLRSGSGPEHEVLRRFLHIIQVHRQDFNGRLITIRTGDVRALACFFGITSDAMGDRLDHLGLRVAS
jgi:transcriptional regulator with XRE-family HTH domain